MRYRTLLLACAVTGGVAISSRLNAGDDVGPPLRVVSAAHELRFAGARTSLLVLRYDQTVDEIVDVTTQAAFRSLTADICAVSAGGIVTPVGDGTGRIEVRWQDDRTVTTVQVRDSAVTRPFHFERDIVPILSRYGCNTSGCHGKAEGQNGFKLSVFGFDPAADFTALLQESQGRRVRLTRPAESLLLTKATGRIPHGGGARIPVDSIEYQLLHDWIAAGAPFGRPDAPQAVSVKQYPSHRRMRFGETQQLQLTATYSDGEQIDVTPLARFQSNNEGLATVDEHGRVTVGNTPGDVAIMAAFAGHVDVFRVLIPQMVSTDGVARPPVQSRFDELVDAKLTQLGIVPSGLCSDSDFLRRATLDIIGTLPNADETRAFLADTAADKRARLVDALLQRPEYADYWALKWADLLRVDREKLGARGAYQFYAWIRQHFRENRPLDALARGLLTAEGTLSEQPAGYWFKVLSKPGERANAAAQVLLGVRIECAQCHHHPFDRWSQDDYFGMQALFAQTAFKPSPRGELLFTLDKAPETRHPRSNDVVLPHVLGEPQHPVAEDQDRRQALADWLAAESNPWFARNLANRLWAHFLGRGIVEPVDDFRLTNPPSNPELLDALAEKLVAVGFDQHVMIRAITASRTYQLSSTPNGTNRSDEQNYSRAMLRPLEAEVLLDAVCQVTGVPEKFDNVPAGVRAIQLWDSHVPHEFLKTFGRPVRATACTCERVGEPTVVQALKLMNSPSLQSKFTHAEGNVARWTRLDSAAAVEQMYLTFFNRFPDEAERQLVIDKLSTSGAGRQQTIEDLAWSLMNSTEFLFQH